MGLFVKHAQRSLHRFGAKFSNIRRAYNTSLHAVVPQVTETKQLWTRRSTRAFRNWAKFYSKKEARTNSKRKIRTNEKENIWNYYTKCSTLTTPTLLSNPNVPRTAQVYQSKHPTWCRIPSRCRFDRFRVARSTYHAVRVPWLQRCFLVRDYKDSSFLRQQRSVDWKTYKTHDSSFPLAKNDVFYCLDLGPISGYPCQNSSSQRCCCNLRILVFLGQLAVPSRTTTHMRCQIQSSAHEFTINTKRLLPRSRCGQRNVPGNHATAETPAHQPLRERQEVREQAQPRLHASLFSRGLCAEKTLVAFEPS